MKKLAHMLLVLLAGLPLFAQQEQEDSLVWLMSAKSAKMVDVEGASYRKVIGPARFLHNGTYLLCDTALWNVETKIIDAWGNVSIIQEETVLKSDKLTYLVEQDLAQFRGSVVQLTDKDHNTLRTRHLDYNTKDSVAVFMNGGAMRDKDGQIIESRNGTYDSKIKKFTFDQNVNMFTDSIFVKTRNLVYESDYNLATFGAGTDAWQDDNMLSSDAGWYDRGRELFLFYDKVHVMTPDQEGWCDSLYFHRMTSDVEMLGRAQITDTTRNVFALAGSIVYKDTLSKVTLTRDPAVITQTEEKDGSVDTVYLGADRLVYFTQKRYQVDSAFVVDAEARLAALQTDPVGAFRKKAAEAAAKAAEEAAQNDPNYKAKQAAEAMKQGTGAKPKANGKRPSAAPPHPDSTSVAMPQMVADTVARTDTVALPAMQEIADTLAVPDSVAALADTVAVEPLDTTRIGFLEALRNVRIYKKDMQVVCDSLVYSDLDSLARLFKEPIIWQEVTRQYTADSIYVVIRNGSMDKANLLSNAFITIQEDSLHYDQIKATEMLAFFDSKGGLTRFDALGGASALFYIEENESLATVNKTDSKMLSATFKDGELERIYYFESPKNDGYPVVQLPPEEQRLKGFNWQPEKRPADRNAVTPLSLRPSQRISYSARPRATFKQTDIYFPGYMNDIYRQIEVRDSLRAVRERDRQIAEARAAEKARLDSLALADSLASVDSLARVDSLAVKDSLAALDSLAMSADSLALADSLARTDSIAAQKVLTPAEIKAAERAARKAELEAKRKKKQEEREARWAELDKRDAEKAAAKEARKLEKLRRRKIKALEDTARQAEKDSRALEKYRKQYEKKKARQDAVAARRAQKKLKEK
ncbi:MAG: hypothetical protein E7124_07715 [Bacteroidales bacterium]|nr:hypothetical protein [Bacteroidales bacterium]